MLEKLLQKNETIINVAYIIIKLLIFNLSSFIAFKIYLSEESFEDYFFIPILISFINIIFESFFFKIGNYYNTELKSFFYKDIYSFLSSVLIIILLQLY